MLDVKRILAHLIMAGAVLSTTAVGRAQGAANPQTFDVAGIRLGMTPAQVMAAIASYDPKLGIQTSYYCGNLSDAECLHRPGFVPPIGIIHASKTLTYAEDSGSTEGIDVTFSSIPGKERVVSVVLDRSYSLGPGKFPSAPVLEKAIASKFPADSLKRTQGSFTIAYFTDGKGRSLNDSSYKMNDDGTFIRGMLMTPFVPIVATAGTGVTFVGRVSEGQGLASGVQLFLFDQGKMYDAAMERDRFNAANIAQRAAAAATHPTDTKF